MPNHYEYCVLSQLVYNTDGDNPPGDWKKIDSRYEPNEFGFAAAAYKKNDHIVIAFRGTSLLQNPTNLITDIFLKTIHLPNTYGYAELFINNIKNKYPGIPISFTGHSLGAVFAEISACRYKSKAVTFESPGSKHIIDGDTRCGGYDRNNITCYLTAPNAINTSNEQIAGNLRRIYIPHTNGLNAWHATKCLWGTANRMWTYASLGASVATFFASNSPKIVINGASITAESTYITDNGIKLVGKTVEISGGLISTPSLEIIAENIIVKGTTISVNELISSNALYNVIKAKIFSLVKSKIGLQVVNTAEWCFKQHSIDNILNQFVPLTGEAIKYSVVRSWPKLTAKTFFSSDTVKGIFYNLLPARPYNRGLHTLFSENEVIEAQIAMIKGYEIDDAQLNNNYSYRP